ncbi:9998_t:CDS:2, partial [Gigaspora margarita]
LDSSSYDDVFGVILDNEGIRCAVNFDLFDCYGFSAFFTFKDSTAKILGDDILELKIATLNIDQTRTSTFYLNIYTHEEMTFKDTSPKMISGNNYNPVFSDLWSLGILLYTMIHAYVPFEKPFDTITKTLMIEKEINKEFSEKTSKNETIQELDELIDESQNDIGTSLSIQWIPSTSLKNIKLIVKGGFAKTLTKVALKEFISIHEDDKLKNILRESDLGEYLARNFTSIAWKEKLSIILDIAAGLYQIHDRDIVHRDIHPDNKPRDKCVNSKFSVLPYMALEKIKEGKYSYASDIFALGILLIKIATGKHIYANAFVKSYDKAIDGDSEAIKNVPFVYLMEMALKKIRMKRSDDEEIGQNSSIKINYVNNMKNDMNNSISVTFNLRLKLDTYSACHPSQSYL